MARPPLPLGTWGTITRTEVSPGRWRARAKYRDWDGRTRPVERFGKTGAAAERALKEALRDRAKPTDDISDITRDTTLTDLAALWITKREAEGKLAQGTIDNYNEIIDTVIVPAVGAVRVGEATVGRLDAFIRAVESPNYARLARVVLSGMMKLAAQHDAITHNPVADTTRRTADPKPPRALTIAELQQLRVRIATWSGGNVRGGPPRGLDFPDLADCLVGSGGRISEVLAFQKSAIQWADGDTPAMIRITGKVDKRGVFVPQAKSDGAMQWLPMPDFMVAAVKRQIARNLPTDELGLLFPSRTGGPRRTSNIRRQLRAARSTIVYDENGEPDGPEDLFDWVTPHVFRKTVATIIEGVEGMDAAAGQLGHSSPEITRRHYVQRAKVAADMRHALNQLAPVRPVSGGFQVGETKKGPLPDSRKGA